jgi:general stress protein 26
MKNGESTRKDGTLTKKEIAEKASKMLEAVKCVYMATNGENGHPNLRALVTARVEGIKALWFVSDEESSKVQELLRDDKAVIYAPAARGAGEVRFWGNVEILDDMASRKKVWGDEAAAHFPDGIESPSVRILRFKISNGIYVDKNWQKHAFKN